MWKKIEPWQGKVHQGCLNCPPVTQIANLEMIVAVGFGYAAIEKDGEPIFIEGFNDKDFHTLVEFEEMARQDPDHDWRCILEAPLRGRTYQRHEEGKWVLIESNQGFA